MSYKKQHFRKGMDIKKYQDNKFWDKKDLPVPKEDVKIKEQEQDKNKCSPT
tara:strand:- start:651 stop:803 length:153 start_codon:yes stop_codon:yes gene_type:complete